jgi:lysophospholipase L1-like esterase
MKYLLLAAGLLLAAATSPIGTRAATAPADTARLASVPLNRLDLPWWRARFAAKAAEINRSSADLVFYGDSITQNYELAGPESWRDFRAVWDKYYGTRHVLNLGFKGDATSHLLWRIENGEARNMHPRAAVVLIGANNFGRLHWPAAETEVGIEKIVDQLRQRLPGTHILLLSVLPSIRSPWVDSNTVQLNQALARRYRDGTEAKFVDVTRLFMTDGRVDPAKFIDPHLAPPEPALHPTAQTQAQIAAFIEPTLSTWLGDRPR